MNSSHFGKKLKIQHNAIHYVFCTKTNSYQKKYEVKSDILNQSPKLSYYSTFICKLFEQSTTIRKLKIQRKWISIPLFMYFFFPCVDDILYLSSPNINFFRFAMELWWAVARTELGPHLLAMMVSTTMVRGGTSTISFYLYRCPARFSVWVSAILFTHTQHFKGASSKYVTLEYTVLTRDSLCDAHWSLHRNMALLDTLMYKIELIVSDSQIIEIIALLTAVGDNWSNAFLKSIMARSTGYKYFNYLLYLKCTTTAAYKYKQNCN